MKPVPSDYQPERRPIASRDRAISKRAASWLIRRGVTANTVSLTGMLAGIAAGAAFALTANPDWSRIGFTAAAVLMQLRLLGNMLDGMVAVESGNASPVGELYNEVPDRIADMAMFIGAGYAAHSSPELGLFAAIVAVFVAYVRAMGKVAGGPQEFCGPLAKPQRVFLMTLAAVVCAVLPVNIHSHLDSVGFGPLAGGLMTWVLLVCLVGMSATAVRRLRRTANALRQELA